MSSKKPKYNIGDIVILSLYGSIDKITNIKQLDGIYVYEVQQHDGLYVESTLSLYHEKNEKKEESITLEPKFQYGDIVQVIGYEQDLYRIVGWRLEVWRYRNDAWEDTIYELSRVNDGEWLEADEVDIVLVVTEKQSAQFLRRLKQDKSLASKLDSTKLKSLNTYQRKENEEFQLMIDSLFDVYNDYQVLYELFQDDGYKDVMKVVRDSFGKIVRQRKK